MSQQSIELKTKHIEEKTQNYKAKSYFDVNGAAIYQHSMCFFLSQIGECV